MINYGFKNEAEREFPPMLIVGTTLACNARCIHCPHPLVIAKKKHSQNSIMSWEIYKRIADEASKYKTLFRFSALGEPLMHPKATEMIEYAKEIGMERVSLNTNGALLSYDIAHRLLRAGIDVIEFSLDAFSREKYELIRKGLNFDKVMNNLKNLIELRNSLNTKTAIIVSIIDQPEVRDEISDFVRYWEKYVDGVIVRKYLSYSGIMDVRKEKRPYYKKRIPCPYAWHRMSVDPLGNIRICIDDWLDKGIVANIKTTTIHDVWTGGIGTNWRSAHLKGKFYKISKCQDCTDWRFHSWEINYFRAIEEVYERRKR